LENIKLGTFTSLLLLLGKLNPCDENRRIMMMKLLSKTSRLRNRKRERERESGREKRGGERERK
jgi:hypothetical protein